MAYRGLDKEPPLHLAVRKGQGSVVRILVENNSANIECKSSGCLTALHMAARRGHLEILEMLLGYNAEVDCVDDFGKTPLHFAIEGGHTTVAKMLLEHGSDKSLVTTDGDTPLHVAASRGHLDIVETLLFFGADIESKDNKERTPLCCAIENRKCAVVRALLDGGSNLEYRGKYGLTGLHVAAQRGHQTIIEILLKYGALFESKDDFDRTPLCLATLEGYEGSVKVLLENGANVKNEDKYLLHVAARRGHCKVVELLLHYEADINCQDAQGRTPLHVAVEEGHYHVVNALLQQYADVNAVCEGETTPLHIAVRRSPVIVEKLLLFGACIDAKNSCGKTPLHMACIHNEREVVAILLQFGADINVSCNSRRVPLDYINSLYVGYNEQKVSRRLLSGPDSIIHMLKQHILKIKVANLRLHDKNQSACNNQLTERLYYDFVNACEFEIKLMKTTHIVSQITYYDIFKQIRDPVYVANSSVMNVLNTTYFNQYIPIYSDILRNTLNKSKCRYYLLNTSQKRFRSLIKSTNSLPVLPDEITRLILTLLENNDLQNISIC